MVSSFDFRAVRLATPTVSSVELEARALSASGRHASAIVSVVQAPRSHTRLCTATGTSYIAPVPDRYRHRPVEGVGLWNFSERSVGHGWPPPPRTHVTPHSRTGPVHAWWRGPPGVWCDGEVTALCALLVVQLPVATVRKHETVQLRVGPCSSSLRSPLSVGPRAGSNVFWTCPTLAAFSLGLAYDR